MRTMFVALCIALCVAAKVRVQAQPPVTNGGVVDQTGLPLPGAVVRLRPGDVVVAEVITRGDATFDLPGHFNPRDVYPVAGAPRYCDFTNSVGPILRGFMLIKW